MKVLELIASPVRAVKEMLDLEDEPPSLVNQLLQLKQQVAELESRLQETHQLSAEKEALLAKLRDVSAVQDNMVVDGPAYFIKKPGNILDGPYCTSCFDHKHETARIVSAAQPQGADGDGSGWVQCSQCQVPFQSERLSEYLNPPQATPKKKTPSKAASTKDTQVKKAKPARKTLPKPKARRTASAGNRKTR